MFTVAVISGNTVTLKARCIYYIDMELKYAIITAAAVTLLMIVGPSNAAQAYWGNWGKVMDLEMDMAQMIGAQTMVEVIIANNQDPIMLAIK